MEQEVRREVFDQLTLRVEPTSSGSFRRIVPEDSGKACYVSADNQVYEDEIWKVRLATMRIPFNGQQQYRVRVDYKGKNALPGTRCYDCVRNFDTGIINLSVRDYKREDGSVRSKVDIAGTHYSDLLSDNFGIWDSYFSGTPNDSYSADCGDDFCTAIVSDGKVCCWLGEERIEDPGLEDLARILQADESYYEVSGATWAVVIRRDKYGELDPQIEVRTEESDFKKLFASLEQYLIKVDLARFDDVLNMVPE